MIPVLVMGAAGRMGGHVLRAVEAAPDLCVAAALDRPGHPELGQELSPGVKLGAALEPALDQAKVAIDFSTPDGTLALVAGAPTKDVALVIATTGFDEEGLARIKAAAQKTPIVMAPNFSLGVNLLIDLVTEAARRLEGYEIEVLEIHHSRKVDAPSGTALRLARAAAEVRGQDLERAAVYHREGQVGPRPPDAIGIQALRAGDSVGEHTVYLAGPGERVELSHRALSRDNFAAGAVRAAGWVVGKPPGLYSMSDVLEG
jgi:4-hydroxy-tetrahydrodipicolinate reductase